MTEELAKDIRDFLEANKQKLAEISSGRFITVAAVVHAFCKIQESPVSQTDVVNAFSVTVSPIKYRMDTLREMFNLDIPC